MAESKPPLDQRHQVTLLQAGLITSGLYILAATILWATYLVAMSLDQSILRNNGETGVLFSLLTLVNAFIFYVWGLNALRHAVTHLRRLTEPTHETAPTD